MEATMNQVKKELVPKLRFPEFKKDGEWSQELGSALFDSISNKKHKSDLPILAITQEHGAIPRDKIDYRVSVTEKSIESYKVVEVGDFIISLRSFQGGIEYSTYKGLCSPAYIILRGKRNDRKDFFRYYFKTSGFIEDLNHDIEGIRDGKMVSYEQFSKIIIPLPKSKIEQQKIADCLSSLDELIEAQDKKLEALQRHKKGLMQELFPVNGETLTKLRFKEFEKDGEWEEIILSDVLTEHKLKNDGKSKVHSVSVHKGIIDQIEHLGRSFASSDTSKYNLVKPFDIVYTKSPTGDFPFGIIKQSRLDYNVIVSPLYGVFSPKNKYLGYILNCYFESPIRTKNYLDPITQKGAKNTIQISNDTFISRGLYLPEDEIEQQKIADCLSSIDNLITNQTKKLESLRLHKKGLMQQLFPNFSEAQ